MSEDLETNPHKMNYAPGWCRPNMQCTLQPSVWEHNSICTRPPSPHIKGSILKGIIDQ